MRVGTPRATTIQAPGGMWPPDAFSQPEQPKAVSLRRDLIPSGGSATRPTVLNAELLQSECRDSLNKSYRRDDLICM
jgi:hypothetical protein